MKHLIYILPFIFFYSCQNKHEKVNNEYCAAKFDTVFMNLYENDPKVKILECKETTPKFAENFYTTNELSKYIFFKLKNEESRFIVAVDTINDKDFHSLFLCHTLWGKQFIDDDWYAVCNLNFLNNCGIKIDSVKTKNYRWYVNSYNEKLIGKWTQDSIYGEKNDNIDDIIFYKKKYIINAIDTIPYYKQAHEFFSPIDSVKIFECLALSEKRLILCINNDTIFLSK